MKLSPINQRPLRFFLASPLALLSLAIVLLYWLLTVAASFGWIAGHYDFARPENSYLPPSAEHWFGTDFLGRDVLARAVQGTRIAFFVGFFAAGLSTLLGVLLGAVAGYFGKWVDDLVVWLYTTLDSIPSILLLSAFAFSLGQGETNLYLALGLTGWVPLCRLIRAEMLRQKQLDYLQAAEALGVSHSQRIFKHLLPNLFHLCLVEFSLRFVFAIKYEVILSFLGVGVEPGTPSWGMMINDAIVELPRGVWWNLTAAALFMFFLVLAMNLLADSIRASLDPKEQR